LTQILAIEYLKSQMRNSQTYLLGLSKNHMSQGLVLKNPTVD